MRRLVALAAAFTALAAAAPAQAATIDDGRGLQLHDDADHLHGLLGPVAEREEPAGGRAGEAEDHLHAEGKPLLHDRERRRPLVGRPLRLPPAALALRPVGDDAEAEAGAEVGAALPHPAPPRAHGLPRRDDREPGRTRLPRLTQRDAESQAPLAVS